VLIKNLCQQTKLKIRKKPYNGVENESSLPAYESEVVVIENAASGSEGNEISSSEGLSELVSSESLESQSLEVMQKEDICSMNFEPAVEVKVHIYVFALFAVIKYIPKPIQ